MKEIEAAMSLVTSLEGWPSASTAAAGASREKRGQARSMVERAKLFSACSTLSSNRRARAPYEASWLALWNPSTLHKRGSCKRWVATCRRSSCVAAAAPQPREGTPRSRTGAAPPTSGRFEMGAARGEKEASDNDTSRS